QGGEWREVDWQTGLEYVANGLQDIDAEHGANSVGVLASPHSTLEELYLAGVWVRGMGSGKIDHRLRHADFTPAAGIRWLGRSVASLSSLDAALVVGSNLRKDHPLFAQRIRQSTRKGAAVFALQSEEADWAMALAGAYAAPASEW